MEGGLCALLRVGRILVLQGNRRICLRLKKLLLLCCALIPLHEQWWLCKRITRVGVPCSQCRGLCSDGILSGNPLLDFFLRAKDSVLLLACCNEDLFLSFCLRLNLCQVQGFWVVRLRLLLLSVHESFLPVVALVVALCGGG